MGTTQSKEEVINVQTGNGQVENTSTFSLSVYEGLGLLAFVGVVIMLLGVGIFCIHKKCEKHLEMRIDRQVREAVRRSQELTEIVNSA